MATFVEFISQLHNSKQQAIVWHHQTDEFEVHKALDMFYTEIVDLVDGLVESTSGVYGRPQGYSVQTLKDYVDCESVILYFQSLYSYIQTERNGIYQETWIQNQVDEVAQLVAETIYQLTLC
jgi:RNA binding exosome subunit